MSDNNEAAGGGVAPSTWDIYVPGMWRCAKCSFVLTQSNLNAADGSVTARDTPGDKCPNCNVPLWRLTWRQHALEMGERLEQEILNRSPRDQASGAMLASLEKIRRTPSMPFPDPGAHSWQAWGRAVHRAWIDIQRIASEGASSARSAGIEPKEPNT